MPLPLTKVQALKAIRWMKEQFMDAMSDAVRDSPFSVDTLCGIACQETAYVWHSWIGQKKVDTILALCVFDASGDYPGTQRRAFPRNTEAFRAKYGEAFTGLLIHEANRSRKERELPPKQWVYKGYGIYQYDLQHVRGDEMFFREKQWYLYDKCLEKVMLELNRKWVVHKDMFRTVKAYNGSGPRAEQYANNVMIFIDYSREVMI